MKLTKETKIGLLAIVALAILYAGISYLKGLNLFKKKNTYYAYFENVNNVNEASPVLIDGYKVGIVTKINFDYDKGHGAYLVCDLDPKVKLMKGTRVSISQTALSGAEIYLNRPETPTSSYYISGDTLPTGQGGDIFSKTAKIIPAVADLMPKIDAMITSITNLLNRQEIGNILASLQATADKLDQTMAKLNSASGQLDPMLSNANNAITGINGLTEKVNKIDFESINPTLKNLQEMTNELKQVTEQLKKKDNTAGLMLNDDKLYHRLDSLANSADELMKDLKKNPKRYVHFSLF